MKNKVVVMIRLDSGDEMLFTAKANDRDINDKEYSAMMDKFKSAYNKLDLNDILYFTIRCVFYGKKSNYRFSSFEETYNKLDSFRLATNS